MISPDSNIFDIRNLRSSREIKLGKSSVVIKTNHGSEVLSWDTRSMVLKNHNIGVCWVSDNDGLARTFSIIIDRLSRVNKDLYVIFK